MEMMSMFSGGGLVEKGAERAGLVPTVAIEINPVIAEYYRRNIGNHVIVADVDSVSYSRFHGIPFLWASPSCKNASYANKKGGETAEDVTSARATARAVTEIQPKYFILENTWGYRNFPKSFPIIIQALAGYRYNYALIDFANLGVPQRRKRLVLVAVRGNGDIPRFPQKQAKVGWYSAVSHLIDTMPIATLPPWLASRSYTMSQSANHWLFPVDAKSSANLVNQNNPAMTRRTTVTAGDMYILLSAGNSSSDLTAKAHEPSFTLRALRSELPFTFNSETDEVRRFTNRALANLQTIPPDYELPPTNTLAATIIGNGVPCTGAYHIIKNLIENY